MREDWFSLHLVKAHCSTSLSLVILKNLLTDSRLYIHSITYRSLRMVPVIKCGHILFCLLLHEGGLIFLTSGRSSLQYIPFSGHLTEFVNWQCLCIFTVLSIAPLEWCLLSNVDIPYTISCSVCFYMREDWFSLRLVEAQCRTSLFLVILKNLLTDSRLYIRGITYHSLRMVPVIKCGHTLHCILFCLLLHEGGLIFPTSGWSSMQYIPFPGHLKEFVNRQCLYKILPYELLFHAIPLHLQLSTAHYGLLWQDSKSIQFYMWSVIPHVQFHYRYIFYMIHY